MNYAVIPASSSPVFVVSIGNNYNVPDQYDMEDIRDWFNQHKDWYLRRKELRKSSFHIKIKCWPQVSNAKKWVWLITNRDPINYPFSSKDVDSWKGIFENAANDPEYFIFTWGGYSLKRVNKNLVPFI